jgi:hypothetical protein
MDKESQALLLFTNRLLMDLISIGVDTGALDRSLVSQLITFSADEVVKGAPWLEDEVRFFEKLTAERLPAKPE